MTTPIAMPELTFAPQGAANAAQPMPATPDSVARFEQLMYAPSGSANVQPAANGLLTAQVGESRLQVHLQRLSDRWEAGQVTLQKFTGNAEFTTKDLIQTQMQMISCALDVELSAKCAGIFENGVQTLTQRS